MKKVKLTGEKMAKDRAEEEAESRKRASRDKMHDMRQKLDSDIDKNSLLE